MDYKDKYIKYKTKYLKLKDIDLNNQIGGGNEFSNKMYNFIKQLNSDYGIIIF